MVFLIIAINRIFKCLSVVQEISVSSQEYQTQKMAKAFALALESHAEKNEKELDVKPEQVSSFIQQQKTAQAEPVQQDLTIDIVKQKWPEIISKLKKQKMILGVFLSEGAPINMEMNTLKIGFGPDARLFLEKVETERKFIEETLLEVLGHKITVRCVPVGKDSHRDSPIKQ